MDLLRTTIHSTFNSKSSFPLWLLPPLLLIDAVFCTIIILKVPYTEIDWKAYMEQVSQYRAGERDYAMIKGGTGPLVYPAGHVYIYNYLYGVTRGGVDVGLAQWIFMGVYLVTVGVVGLCYREARAPPYILPFLILSKRLHSIYMLRLFNDPFSILLLFLAVFAWQKKLWTLGSLAYSLSVGVKMNTLLALPAVGGLYLLALGRDKALRQAGIMLQLQLLLATPFLTEFPMSYLNRAFEFTRQFFFQWTVNWRFVGEEVFLSKGFSLGLLGLHACLLLFFLVTRWSKSPGISNEPARNPQVCPHRRSWCERNRHALRSQPALPVLLMACLGYPLPSLAQWVWAWVGYGALGCTGVGVERVP
ncbi:ALG3 protein-domain-containing protein [Tuber indicum]|nr:ALG3 protein-domain-containing protein [Tuber indicum]